jgi:hypothetical protein
MASSSTQDSGSDAVYDDELTSVIHEEIGRLPEKYRAAVVLCYLEGLTHEMAAEHLGWPVGSVKSRLAWARERLRVRLTRRGVAPTSVPFDRAGSSRDVGSAETPVLLGTSLLDATLRGALKAGMGKEALVGIVSAEAVVLMEGIIKSMTNAKLMLMMAAVLIAGLVTAGAGVMGYSATRPENPALALAPPSQARQPAATARVAQDPPRPAGMKPATNQGPVVIRAAVVDPEGRRLSGVDIAVSVWYSGVSGVTEAFLERTKTDGAGQVRLEIASERSGAIVHHADIWAYQSGRAVATSHVLLTRKPSQALIYLTLEQPAKWTITVLGPDDRPIAGLRLAPRSIRLTSRQISWLTVPDGYLEPLTVKTDEKGVAALTYLSQSMVPLAIHVAGTGVASHTLPLDAPQTKDIVLRLGRSGRLVGVVRAASGQPLTDVPVEVWVQASGTLPSDLGFSTGNRRITRDAILRFDPQSLKTGPQGAFQTPATLLSGSTYRVSIRQKGFVAFVSEWVTLDGERAEIPLIRLQPLQKLTGQVKDRQGRAIAGARVFLPSSGPRTATDIEGRFALAGINPGKTVILVEQSGFRLHGWLVDPSAKADVGLLTLVRINEAPGPVVRPLADPIPAEESRALADRLLEPYFHDIEENGDDGRRLAAIGVLSQFNLVRALDLLQNGKFREKDWAYQTIRGSLAAKLAETDPALAYALVESINDPLARATALPTVAKALPALERGRKRALLDQATTLLQDRLQQANPTTRLRLIAAIAEQWLDMGERDRARSLLEQAKSSTIVYESGILVQMAGLEPDRILVRLKEMPNFTSTGDELTRVAVQLATEHPDLAEQVFNLRGPAGGQSLFIIEELRLCRRLARVDPPRARRVAASPNGIGARACGWAFVAFGLSEKDKAGASEAMDRAIEEIDRIRESGSGLEQAGHIVGGIRSIYPNNPAAVILPVVERIAPERLDEVFWRAVALHPGIEAGREDQIWSSYIGFECTLLARYDRGVAAALFEPMDSYRRSLAARTGSRDEFTAGVITAKGCIDPRAAVALLESLTPPRESAKSNPAHGARLRLAEVLGLPSERRWLHLCRSFLPLDD